MELSAKTIYSKLNITSISEEDMILLKKLCAELLFDIHEICNENNIKYIAAFGTLLGTVRHKGYIPWDDDIDIHMKYSDIPFFKQKFLERYKDKYRFTPSNFSPIFFDIVEFKNTRIYEAEIGNKKMCRGIKIDIFPLEYTYDNKLREKIREKLKYLLITLHSLSFNFKYPSEIIKNHPDRKTRIYYKARRILGCFASIFPNKFYHFLYRHLCICKKESNLLSTDKISTILPNSIIENRKLAEFEGHKIYIPEDSDFYLQTIYGPDYMMLPPENERETHSILKIDFGPFK